MKNLLVTGGLGFIGSNFVNYMAEKYPFCNIIILDMLDYCASIENVSKRDNVEIVIGDIANKELINYLLNKNNIDYIAHVAAKSSVDNSYFNSIPFTETNVLGTHILFECIRIYHENTNNVKKILYVSTDEVYGESLSDHPMTETSIYAPTNIYAATKAASELIIMAYYRSYKLPIVISRGNNVYSINQFPDKIISKFICLLLNGKKIPIHGDGSSQRNFIHVYDTVKAFELILFEGIVGEIYNISADSHCEYTVMEIAKILIELIYPNNNWVDYIEYVEDRKFNDKRYNITSDKLKLLGWDTEKKDFLQELKNLIEWYKINKHRYGF
jgi:UDP-glucose 4,6-dehydratase